MSAVVLITGAATGIGNLTARALAAAGHTVYASMRNVDGRNAGHANDLLELGRRERLDLHAVELDVQSESSAAAAVATILSEAGQVTAYEVSQFGIETTIVMPGPFTQGTEHFPNASHAGDEERNRAYAELDPLVARNEDATSALFPPGVDAHPRAVAEEIARILALPAGTRPFPTVVDFSNAGVEQVNEVMRRAQEQFVTRLGFGELLHVKSRRADSSPAGRRARL